MNPFKDRGYQRGVERAKIIEGGASVDSIGQDQTAQIVQSYP